jgi:flagellar biosynthesis repressor protein FlbT
VGLKIKLKPNERLVINSAVISNTGNSECSLKIENKATILRENHIMGEKEADTPCKQLYFIIQLMYLDQENLTRHIQTFSQLSNSIVEAAPSTLVFLDDIVRHVTRKKYYDGLKASRKLINYESQLFSTLASQGKIFSDEK